MRRGGNTERFHKYLVSRGVELSYGLFTEAHRAIGRRHQPVADAVGGNNVGMKSVLVDIYNSQQDHYWDVTAAIRSIG